MHTWASLQVEDVDRKFEALTELQENNWSLVEQKAPSRKAQRPKVKHSSLDRHSPKSWGFSLVAPKWVVAGSI